MKIIVIMAVLMYMGVSHSSKAGDGAHRQLALASLPVADQLLGEFGASTQMTQHQLKQEVSQSVQLLTHNVQQTVTAIFDLALSAVRYVFLSVGQALATLTLNR